LELIKIWWKRKKEHFLNETIKPDILQIESKFISRHHADIFYDKEQNTYKIVDVGSLNGIYKYLKKDEDLTFTRNLFFLYFDQKFQVEGFYRNKESNDLIVVLIINDNSLLYIKVVQNEEIELSPFSNNETIRNVFSKESIEKFIQIHKKKWKKKFPTIIYKNEKIYLKKNSCDLQILVKLESNKSIKEFNKNYFISINKDDEFKIGYEPTIMFTQKITNIVELEDPEEDKDNCQGKECESRSHEYIIKLKDGSKLKGCSSCFENLYDKFGIKEDDIEELVEEINRFN